MNKFFTVIIIFLFSHSAFSQRYSKFEENGKIGIKDDKGTIILAATYDEVFLDFSAETDLARVKLKGKWGYADKAGKLVIPAEYQEAGEFDAAVKLAKVKQNDKYGFIDNSGKAIIAIIYEDAEPHWSAGYAAVSYGGGDKMLDKNGAEIKQ